MKSQKKIEAAIEAAKAGKNVCDTRQDFRLTDDEYDVVRAAFGMSAAGRVSSSLSAQANAAYRRQRSKADLATYDPLDTSFGGLNKD